MAASRSLTRSAPYKNRTLRPHLNLNRNNLGAIILIILSSVTLTCHSQRSDVYPQRGGSKCYDDQGMAQRCIPEFVNAAFNVRVESTNTCGLRDSPTEFCVQTGVTGAKKSCQLCDAANPNLAHGPQFLTDFNNNDNLTWWQSETMLEGVQYPKTVNLTLRLKKAFDITYVRLKFHSSRPESFAIYKRMIEDGPWIPYQYYSATCRDTFGLDDNSYVTRADETRALCTTEFSDISPLTGGNVAFSTLEGRPSAYNFENTPVLQDWVAATDIRITLDRLNTFGDEVFRDPKVLKSYFYAISDFAVGGRCRCNGHASECRKLKAPDDQIQQECVCHHNTAGRDCELCLDFYNDRPWGRADAMSANECQPCSCNGRSQRCYFDKDLYERTGHGGHCIDCVGNTDGPNCERCRENYYQRSDGICVPCNCNEIGTQKRSHQCNNHGLCTCKPGVTGEKCDRCEANHYDFGPEGCKSCKCEVAGSLSNNPHCDSATGICQCKENVEDKRCSTCLPGFFNLDFENEFGCTPCFCYGHSSICRSAPGYSRTQIESTFTRDAERWLAAEQYGAPVPMQYNANVGNIAVSAPSREMVYFLAPKRFLGDQRASYNQHLSFTFRINQDGPRATVEDIVLEGAGLTISQPIFGNGNPLPTIQNQEYKFRLHDHLNFGWNPRLSSRDFISVLSNLTAIKIRATYTIAGIGILDNVRLESAQRGGIGVEARWIEMCTCPDGYVGQFCESCAPGYRPDPPGGGPFARCVRCNCHGHADICDATTGRCRCEHNTAGDNCERCTRGYYGNALAGTHYDCQPCPCPNHGSCIDLGHGQVACLECPQGYGGHNCDVCTDGFYGDPNGRFGPSRACQKCDCNGNIDPNAVSNCNRTSGECLKCIYNTAGVHCERCLVSYFGDALALPKGGCKSCGCSPYGSLQRGRGPTYCDSVTGQCECLNHVRGLQCDRCEDGYTKLHSGEGCEQCSCDPVGSLNQTCDIRTGQCFCRPGVTGKQCDKCQSYHYAFSYEGCEACDCDHVGSLNLQCDSHSGQCQCRENVEGRQCDRCKENKYNKQAGCIDCPPCYNLVQDAVNIHRSELHELTELLDNISNNPQLLNDLDFEKKLHEVMGRVNTLLTDAENAGGEDQSLLKQLGDLRKRIADVQGTADKIDEKVSSADAGSKRGIHNITDAEDAIKRAREALQNAQRYLQNEGEEALQKAKDRSEQFGQQSDRMTDIAREASAEADSQTEDAKNIEDMAQKALNTSQEAYKIARDAIDQQRETGNDIDKLQKQLRDLDDLAERTKKLADEARNEADTVHADALEIYIEATSLALPNTDIPKMMQDAAEIREEAKKIQDEADDLMNRNKDLVDGLQNEMGVAEDLLEKGNQQQQIADKLLAEADVALTDANAAVEMGDKTLEEAQKTLTTLKEFDGLVKESKGKATEALKKIPDIEKMINEAESKTEEVQKSLIGAKTDAGDARDIAKEAQRIAEESSRVANGIRQEADTTKDRAGQLKDKADDLARGVANTGNRLKDLEDQAETEHNLAKEALERANEAKINAQQSSRKVKDALDSVNEIVEALRKLGDVDTDQLRELKKKLDAAEQELADADLDSRMGALREARMLQNKWVRDYEEEMEKLRMDVDNVRAIRESLPDACYRRIKLEPEP